MGSYHLSAPTVLRNTLVKSDLINICLQHTKRSSSIVNCVARDLLTFQNLKSILLPIQMKDFFSVKCVKIGLNLKVV